MTTNNNSQFDGTDSGESASTAYNEIRDISKLLHGVLHPVTVDASVIKHTKERIPEAVNGLDYVIEKTLEATNQTLDLVEDSLPVASRFRDKAKSLQAKWSKFRTNDSGVEGLDELSDDLHDFFGDADKMSTHLSNNLSAILMTQEFQDLTGQVIRRVMNDVKSVDERLNSIVSGVVGEAPGAIEGSADKLDSQAVGQGPVIDQSTEQGAIADQADVDDILSDLDL